MRLPARSYYRPPAQLVRSVLRAAVMKPPPAVRYMLLAWLQHGARSVSQSCPPRERRKVSTPSLAKIRSHLYLYFALQMGNVSNALVFVSTLSEREDLIFGTLYLVFGKERQPVIPLSLLWAAQVPAFERHSGLLQSLMLPEAFSH